ncbi:MAG: AAA family ATPase [Verrucomicrobiales bacterium]|nr:AAA family ATPase [Verrucomicrobiales bacterium]
MSHSTTQGSKLDAISLESILSHIFERNDKLGMKGSRGTPVCIWGTHGLGKTEMVKDYANSRGWHLAYCAPAQFEEMGDLHGLPTIHDPTPDKPHSGDEYTVFAPPDWVPKEKGPGILLLDDVNRADDRILRGIMQLLQNFEMFSWQLPEQWQILATANPEGADYSVTPMDDAMLTRMLHFTLTFDAKAWGKWAVSAGVDPRGIAFVLNYPETVTGKRTTPRTLAHFFEQIEDITDLKANIELVATLATSTLDESTVAAFVSFVNDDLAQLLYPEDILDSKNSKGWKKRFSDLAKGKGGVKRVDRISAICTRLFLHVTAENYKAKPEHAGNFAEFLLQETIPNDLRGSLMMDLNKHPSDVTRALLKDKRLAKLLLEKL